MSERVLIDFRPRSGTWYDRTPASLSHYERTLKCRVCFSPGPKWMKDPTPVDCELIKRPKGILSSADSFPRLIRSDFLDVLQPHIPDAMIGECRVHKEPNPSGYFTVCFDPGGDLETHRGPNCRHETCAGCGRIRNAVGWAQGLVLSRCLDERLVYHDVSDAICMDSGLVEYLRLAERFPDLHFNPVRVAAEPLDGDVLPGDPTWDGVFRPQPRRPEVKEARFKWKGWTWRL